MKKLLLFSIISIHSLNYAQIQLNSTDFATGGDTVRISQANDNSYDYSSTGAAYTWDFSSLIPTSQLVKDYRSLVGAPAFINFVFGTFAPVNYQSNYYIESTAIPVAQLSSFLPVTIDNIFQFTKISTSAVSSTGFSMVVNGNDLPFKSDTIEKRFLLPLDYGNSNFSRGYTKVDFNPTFDAIWIQHRTRTTEVDGYGVLTTPFGVFNTLRVKHDITEIDSLYTILPFVGATWIPLPIPLSHEYEWWANNEKFPILKFITNIVGGNEVVTGIEYRDVNRNLDAGLSELRMDLFMFPNPVMNELTVNCSEIIEAICIFDANGAKVFDKNGINESQISIDVTKFKTGSYQIQFLAGSKSDLRTFIKL